MQFDLSMLDCDCEKIDYPGRAEVEVCRIYRGALVGLGCVGGTSEGHGSKQFFPSWLE